MCEVQGSAGFYGVVLGLIGLGPINKHTLHTRKLSMVAGIFPD